MNDRARTHRTWFERDPEVATVESILAECDARGANRNDFRMRRRIPAGACCVAGGRDDGCSARYDRTDRNFANKCCLTRDL